MFALLSFGNHDIYESLSINLHHMISVTYFIGKFPTHPFPISETRPCQGEPMAAVQAQEGCSAELRGRGEPWMNQDRFDWCACSCCSLACFCWFLCFFMMDFHGFGRFLGHV